MEGTACQWTVNPNFKIRWGCWEQEHVTAAQQIVSLEEEPTLDSVPGLSLETACPSRYEHCPLLALYYLCSDANMSTLI